VRLMVMEERGDDGGGEADGPGWEDGVLDVEALHVGSGAEDDEGDGREYANAARAAAAEEGMSDETSDDDDIDFGDDDMPVMAPSFVVGAAGDKWAPEQCEMEDAWAGASPSAAEAVEVAVEVVEAGAAVEAEAPAQAGRGGGALRRRVARRVQPRRSQAQE
jgi:hypothetical protein